MCLSHSSPPAFLPSTKTAVSVNSLAFCISSVSYTHLDVYKRQPVGRSQLEERPQDEQIGNVWNEIFSDLICPHGPPPLHVLSVSAFLWKADPPPVAVVLGWELGSILLCLTPSGNTQKSRRSLRLQMCIRDRRRPGQDNFFSASPADKGR